MDGGEVIDHMTDNGSDTPLTRALKISGYMPSPRITFDQHVNACWSGAVDEIARLANSMCPFTTVLIAPSWRGMPEESGGEAFASQDLIFLPLRDTWPDKWVECFFHELWHICSRKLSTKQYKLCAEVVASTPGIGDAGYYDKIDERLARLFAHWSMSVWMGWESITNDPRTHHTPSAIFGAIYSGHFAQVLMDKQ